MVESIDLARKNLAARIFAAMCFFGALSPAIAADVFVVDAKGIDLPLGQKLDGSKPLVLAVGQRVTLVSGDGRTIKLKGPTDAAPAPETENGGNGVITSLKGLMQARQSDTTAAGIIRQGNVSFTQPEPWLVEIQHTGDRCLMAGEKIVLWRGEAPVSPDHLEITPVDRSWAASAVWPAGSDRLALPGNLKLNNGQAYLIGLEASSINVTIHVIPASVVSDAAKVAWMLEVGCDSQAKALIDALE